MQARSEYEELLGLMAQFGSCYLDPAWQKKKAGEILKRPTDRQFEQIFYGFTEIISSIEALELSESLLGLAPPRSKRVNKDNYLKFLVGAYLQEVYILEQRLTAYARKISRLYRKPSLSSLVRQIVYEPLKGIIETRGSHVHERRFSDERLDMLSTVALFRHLGHHLGEDLKMEYMVAQSQWCRQVKENNRMTREILDRYSGLIKTVICVDGRVALPLSAPA